MTLWMLMFLALPAWAQDQQPAGDAAPPAQGDAADAADGATDPADTSDPDSDDSDLDEQTYEEDDDDFVPTEEIPADEPIPFPSNI